MVKVNVEIGSKTAEDIEIGTTPSTGKKVMVVRTANDFIYNDMDWESLGSTKKEV